MTGFAAIVKHGDKKPLEMRISATLHTLDGTSARQGVALTTGERPLDIYERHPPRLATQRAQARAA